MLGLSEGERIFDDKLSRFEKIPDRDRQTDRHISTANIALTHSIARTKPRVTF